MYRTQGPFIEPTSDPGFKILFGREASKDILIGFLNAVLDPEYRDPIRDITYLDKEKQMESPGERTVAYDIHCVTDSNRRFIVEMQNRSQPYFKNRSVFYMARAVTEQGQPSDWEYQFMPVYGIFICQFRVDNADRRVRVDVALKDVETNEVFSDAVHLTYIQLPNYKITSPEDCKTDFERWVYIIKNLGSMETMPFIQEVFKRVEQTARVENLTSAERRRYESELKFYRDYKAQMKFARQEGRAEGHAQGVAEGRAEGRAQGVAEGRAEGRAQGVAEGRAEGRAQGVAEGRAEGEAMMIKALVDGGMGLETIARTLGKSVDEISGLIDKK